MANFMFVLVVDLSSVLFVVIFDDHSPPETEPDKVLNGAKETEIEWQHVPDQVVPYLVVSIRSNLWCLGLDRV